jgi:hypothetical protein
MILEYYLLRMISDGNAGLKRVFMSLIYIAEYLSESLIPYKTNLTTDYTKNGVLFVQVQIFLFSRLF